MGRILRISTMTLLKRVLCMAENIKHPVLLFNKKYELDEMRFFIRKKDNLKVT